MPGDLRQLRHIKGRVMPKGGDEERHKEPHHTCGEGHKGIPFDESALFIQEVVRVKSVRALPLTLIKQNRRKEGKHCGVLQVKTRACQYIV